LVAGAGAAAGAAGAAAGAAAAGASAGAGACTASAPCFSPLMSRLSPPLEITYKARPAKIANPTAIFHIIFSKKNIVYQVWSNHLNEVRALAQWGFVLIGISFKWGQININFVNRRA
jgi:hypothetical protein